MASTGTSDTPTTVPGVAAERTGSSDWPAQATDAIVKAVDSVRDRTTAPALGAARWAAYGLVPALLAVPLLLLAVIGLFRGIEGLLLLVHDHNDWAAFLHDPIGFVYLTIGFLLVIAALASWRKGKRPAAA